MELNLILILVYIFLVLGLGIYTVRKQTSEGFLIAGRDLGIFSSVTTIVASKTGAGTFMTFVALVYLYGFSAICYFLGATVSYILFIPLAVKVRSSSSEKEFYTLSDYFFDKYGKFPGILSAILTFFSMFLILVVQLIGGTKIIVNITGYSYSVSISIIVVSILVYTLAGGLKAVVKTDIVQFLSVFIIIALLSIVLFGKFQFSSLYNSAFVQDTQSLKIIIALTFIGLIMPFSSVDLWQRVYASRDVITIKRSLILSSILYFIIGLFLLVIGLAIRSQVVGIDPDVALVEGFIRLLPPGLLSLGVVALFAAIMSSADSYLFASTSILVQDFYARFIDIEKKKLLSFFRYTIFALILLSVILVTFIQSIITTVFIWSAISSIIAISIIISWIKPRNSKRMVYVGMLFGFWGTLFLIIFKSIDESLALMTIAFTLFGVLIGIALEFIFKMIKRKV